MTSTIQGAVVSEAGRLHLRLQLTPEIGPVRFRALLDHFGSPEAVLGASKAALQGVEGIGPVAAESIRSSNTEEAAALQIERAAASGVRIICQADDEYPAPLRHMPDPPICLFVRGRLEPADAIAVAIVGTRRCSHYGREQALRFAHLLGRAGFTVVSGLARGIDGHAHGGALEAGGRTIAVLGNGLPKIYPPEHIELAGRIEGAGAVITELPMDTAPESTNFPRRNRIIAGLSLGVLVVEAGLRSGSLTTARLAADYNREVFAVPGRIDQAELTSGVHSLIREGAAKLVTCLEDVLNELGQVGEVMGPVKAPGDATKPAAATMDVRAVLPMDAVQRKVLDCLGGRERDVDYLVDQTGFDPAKVLATLTKLQLRALVRRLPGDRFEACAAGKA